MTIELKRVVPAVLGSLLALIILLEAGEAVGEIVADELFPNDSVAKYDAVKYGRALGAFGFLVFVVALTARGKH